jgi:hypothetical protein
MTKSDKKGQIETLNVSKAVYAQMRGISKQAVHKACREGRLTAAIHPDGKLDVELADQLWAANTNPVVGWHSTMKQRQKKLKEDVVEKAIAVGIDPNAVPTLLESKTVEAAFRAKLAQIEYEEKIGKLVPVESVKKEAFRLARIVRDSMFGIADRIAAEIAGISDPFLIHKKLSDEIRTAIAEIKADE